MTAITTRKKIHDHNMKTLTNGEIEQFFIWITISVKKSIQTFPHWLFSLVTFVLILYKWSHFLSYKTLDNAFINLEPNSMAAEMG